jgi:signal peptidase I
VNAIRDRFRRAPAPASKPSPAEPKSGIKQVIELVVTIAVAVGLALLIQAFIVKPYRIPSGSMLPTLHIGQRILANRLISHPSVGDIVVFHPPAGADQANAICGAQSQGTGHDQACDTPTPNESSQTFIKRVVAGPGDTIKIVNGDVYRNGVREKAPFIYQCGNSPDCNFRTPIKIPPGDYFMMGDNRGQSDDSRFWGPVPDKWVIGIAFFTYWPPDRIGFL